MKIINAILLTLFLSGCAIFDTVPEKPPEVKIITETVPLRIYQPPLPNSVKLEDVKFFVITEKNLDEKIEELKKLTGDELVIFAITPFDYENMAYNLQELRRYINQQNELIVYYRRATEGDADTGVEDWLERNKKKD